ncbi:unnamed protein product [Laminaria digitata]
MATLKDLDPWVTAPLFEDECNAMDTINAMVSSRPPGFAGPGSDGSSAGSGAGLRDCPSPSEGGRPGDGPLDRLCGSWENDRTVETGFRTSPVAGAAAAADSVSATEFARACEGLTGTGTRAELPQAALVGDPVIGAGLSASAPPPSTLQAAASAPGATAAPPSAEAVPAGVNQTHATFLQVRGEDAITMSTDGGEAATAPDPVPRRASATPPPLPSKPASVTASFLAKNDAATATAEPLALWDGSSDGVTGGAAAGVVDTGAGAEHAGVPGAVSSQDLLLEWLRREAGKGDEEAQFHLAQLFSPPRFEMKEDCRECGETFGMTRYRHHCRHCGGSFCHEHAWHEHPIPKLGLPTPQRVCTPCKHTLELEDWRERVEWRLERVNAYLGESLIQYFDTGVDTVGDKALRVVDGAIFVAKSAPLGTAVKVSVEVMDVLMKYGTAGVAGLVLRREFVEAVEVLKRLSGVDKKWPMSAHEMTAAMYYLLAQRRGERGAEPNGEHEAHAGNPAVSEEELDFLRRMSALPLHFAYTKTALELQVLCNTTGWSLVFHKTDSRFHQPAFSLLANRATMMAALVVRGTGSIHDVITDIQAIPVPFPPRRGDVTSGDEADGWSDMPPADTVACCGMARAAEWLYREVVHHLIKLHREGHKIVILGHSLGGGVAALLGVLLKDAIPDIRVVAFATPACADIGVSKLCESVCTSVVLHDDVVPRVTPHAVRALLKDLLCTKEGWVKHLYDDWDAVVGRAKGLWAPRWRTASHGAIEAAPDDDPEEAAPGTEGATTASRDDATAAAAAAAAAVTDKIPPTIGEKPPVQGKVDPTATIEVCVAPGSPDVDDEWGGLGSPPPATTAAGGGDVSAEGDVTAPASGAQGNGGGESKGKGRWAQARAGWSTVDVRAVQSRLSRIVDDTSARIRSNIVVKDTVSAAAPPVPPRPVRVDPANPVTDNTKNPAASSGPAGSLVEGKGAAGPVAGGAGSGSGWEEEEEAEVVEELPLPELYVPGRIVHIYSQRGVYRAAEIPRDHDCLRTIPMYGNMLADHASLAYFDALQEIAAVRMAEANGEVMPDWVPFSDFEVCQLCKADFSWASTSRSEAQRARDKHNCRMCGLLVCGPCSNHRKPLPKMGVLEASRICDRCFYGADPSKVV